MTHNDQVQSSWARLPEQVLLLVFQQVQEDEWESSRLHKLAVVCTAFREVLSQSATLCDTINLAKLSSKALPSLIGFMQQHAPHMIEYCNNQRLHSEVLVGLLLACKAPLQRLKLQAFPGAMQILPAFTSLKRCSLVFDTRTDLEPLQGLMNLNDLGLQGSTVHNLQAAAVRLTALQLLHCMAHCSHDCMCVTSLIHLEVINSYVRGFHDLGLCACTCMEQLYCDRSFIGAGDVAGANSHLETLNFVSTGPRVPASLACLTSLTRLSVGFRATSSEVLLDWPTCLTALQCFSALVYPIDDLTHMNILLPQCFSVMVRLRTLCIGGEIIFKCQRVLIEPTFDWRALVSLQQVKLSGEVSASQQYKLSTLASMTTIRELRFTACCPPRDVLVGQLADLAYQLSKFRPDVDFVTAPE